MPSILTKSQRESTYSRAGIVSLLYSAILISTAAGSASSLRTKSSPPQALHFSTSPSKERLWISPQPLHILRVESLLFTSSSGISSWITKGFLPFSSKASKIPLVCPILLRFPSPKSTLSSSVSKKTLKSPIIISSFTSFPLFTISLR